jgi:hypothetical protein
MPHICLAVKLRFMKKIFKNNGLSIVFLSIFIISLVGQFFTGYAYHNEELTQDGHSAITIYQYLYSGHFIQATFENWESEFLQMALFIVLTIFLYQKGSSESKKMDEKEEVDREPSASKPGAPWPVKKGGFILKIYKYSLTIAFVILFIFSFGLHFYGSLKDENEQLALKGMPAITATDYVGESRFWFESFQNWQSEFLSVFAIVVLTIFLRQKGSPQSKPVDAPDNETGE